MKLQNLFETTVNYNHIKNLWVLRKDMEDGRVFPPNAEVPEITLSNASVVVDKASAEQGKRVFAYVQGTPTKTVPEQYTIKRPIKFVRDSNTPFVHVDNNEPYNGSDFIEFNQKGASALYQ